MKLTRGCLHALAVGEGTVASLIKAGVSAAAIRGTASWNALHFRTILRRPKQLVHRHFVIRPPLRNVTQHEMTTVLLRLLSLPMSTQFLFFANHLLAHRLFVASPFCDCLLALSRGMSMSTMPTDVLFTSYHLLLHTIANIFELVLRCVTSLFRISRMLQSFAQRKALQSYLTRGDAFCEHCS